MIQGYPSKNNVLIQSFIVENTKQKKDKDLTLLLKFFQIFRKRVSSHMFVSAICAVLWWNNHW